MARKNRRLKLTAWLVGIMAVIVLITVVVPKSWQQYASSVFTFGIILYVIGRYVWPPLNRMMTERLDHINQVLEEAEAGRKLFRQARLDYKERIDLATRDAQALTEQAQRLGEQLKDEMRARAQAEHDLVLARARVEIERTAQRASRELRGELADLVVETTERVLVRELSPEMHKGLIDEAITGVGTHA